MGVSYMKQFGFLARNAERFAQQLDLGQAVSVSKVNQGRGREAEVCVGQIALCFARFGVIVSHLQVGWGHRFTSTPARSHAWIFS